MIAAVRAAPAATVVLAGAAMVHVVAGSAPQGVVAAAALVHVVAGSAVEPVVAAALVQVVAGSAAEPVAWMQGAWVRKFGLQYDAYRRMGWPLGV